MKWAAILLLIVMPAHADLFARAGYGWYSEYQESRGMWGNPDRTPPTLYGQWIEAAEQQRNALITFESLYALQLQPDDIDISARSFTCASGSIAHKAHFWRRIRFGVEAAIRAVGEDVPAWSNADALIRDWRAAEEAE